MFGTNEITNSLISDLEGIWSSTRGSQNVCIAILDTDVDLEHPAFSDSLDRLHKVTIEGVEPSGNKAHGTYVASLIFGNNDYSIAPNSKGLIIPVYQDTDEGKLGTSQELLAKAIDKAREHGANVINISCLLYTSPSPRDA